MQIKTLNLIKKVNKEGYKIYYEEKEIYLKYPKGIEISSDLLYEIKSHKQDLITYFESFSKSGKTKDENKFLAKPKHHEGEDYYAITATQNYWVDDSMDQEYKQKKKNHDAIIISHEILGTFDKNIFSQSISFLIERHESLRTTFHKVNGDYCMKIHDESSLKTADYIDLRSELLNDLELKEIFNFSDHEFDLQKGPLFLARLIQLENKKFIISLKLHHVISDAYSVQILLRDLLSAYSSLVQNREPELPEIKYHLKENLAAINSYVENNYSSNKEYWNSLYSDLPDELIIPCTKKTEIENFDKICKIENFSYPFELIQKMKSLSKKEAASLFVILQATFKSYLNYKTNQQDIVIGTSVFGRNFEISENQIGCYAKTVLVRTLFGEKEDFSSMIKKVKKANEDMNNYDAFSLIDSIETKLAPGQSVTGSFWKINLHYNETNNAYLNKSDFKNADENLNFEFKPILQEENSIMAIDFELKFFSSSDNLELKVEYDSSLYDSLMVQNFISDYIDFTAKRLSDISF